MRVTSCRATEPGLRAGSVSPNAGRAAAAHAGPVAAARAAQVAATRAAQVAATRAARVAADRAGCAELAKRWAAALTGHGRRRSWRRAAAGVTVAGIAVAAAACGDPGGPVGPAVPEKPDLVVAVVPAEAQAGLYIAQAKGLFTKAGLHVTVKTVLSAQTVIPEMLHGGVDVTGGQYVSYIAEQAKGLAKMRILAAGFALGPHSNEIIAPASAHIRTLGDLKGRTIAVNQLSGISSDLVYAALASYGITPAQVHLVEMPFPAMPSALAAGRITAAYETEPYVTEAVKKYGVQVVADMDSGATQDFPLTGYGALASWVARYPRTAAAFTWAVVQGDAIASTNLAVLQRVLARALHLSPSITGVMATGTFPTSANPVQIQRVADLMLQYGQLKQRFNVESLMGG
ncbi:MAG TPA: ABC transporter substrate-binding protein [Streptosporangiaceae bacterium]|jgi:NitT/TauT family transport system substrate-binding protein